MSHRTRHAVAAGVLAAATIGALSPTADAQTARHHGGDRAVFVQSNGLAGNDVQVYDQSSTGVLTPVASYPTGGLGGMEVGGTADPLGSQGSLVYNRSDHELFAVNAGSDSLTAFAADGTHLDHRQTVPSGGSFPVSVAVHGDLAYVLNAGGAGSLQGYRLHDGRLCALGGPVSLGLSDTNPPSFVASPGQVGFTDHGRDLVVTNKANSATFDVYPVGEDGRLGTPAVDPSANPVPFAFVSRGHRLIVTEAATSSITTYDVGRGGTLTELSSASDGQKALCWVTAADGYVYGANPGSGTVSSFTLDSSGVVQLLDATAATPGGGPTDMVAPAHTRTLWVEDGKDGDLFRYQVGKDGSLTLTGQATGFAATPEGIAAD